jgi:hypothetical protein
MTRPIALRFESLLPSDDRRPTELRTDSGNDAAGLIIRGGRFDTVTDAHAIQQDLRMLLTTRRGERVMRPEYGCDLHRLIFAPNDETTAGMAIHYVKQAIERWEDRITDLRVDADGDGAGRLNITISYRVRRTQQMDRLQVAVNLEPGEGP